MLIKSTYYNSTMIMLLELNLSRTFKRIIKKDVIGISWMEMKRKSCSWIKNLNGKGWEKKKRKFTWMDKKKEKDKMIFCLLT